MSTIVIGSSGYLGSNLLRVLGPECPTVVTRSDVTRNPGFSIDLSSVSLDDSHPLFNEIPQRVYVLARPAESDWAVNRRFYDNLQKLLLKWCSNQELKRVYFTSTSNVYSIEESGIKSCHSHAAPYGVYEYFKLEFELFLEYLHTACRRDVDFYIFRLPIAFGGLFDPERNSNQYIYAFMSNYLNGRTWTFETDEDLQFGTSWIYTPDFVERIANLERENGCYEVLTAASGFITYKDLDMIFESRLQPERLGELKLFRSRMEISNDLGLPQRSLEFEIDRFLFTVPPETGL